MSRILFLLFFVTASFASIEPVLMMQDGHSVEDRDLFHRGHCIVRDWQSARIYGPELLPPEKLQADLGALGLQAKFVPTSFWELVCIKISIENPEFSSLNKPYSGFWDEDFYEKSSRMDPPLEPEEMDKKILLMNKGEVASKVKQYIDRHIVKNYPESGNLTELDKYSPHILDELAKRFHSLLEFNRARHSMEQGVFPEDPRVRLSPPCDNVCAIHNFNKLCEIPQVLKKVFEKEMDFDHLLLMRGTTPSPAQDSLQDSIPYHGDLYRESASRVMKSLSYDTSLFGGLLEDESASVHYYYKDKAIIYGLSLPLPLSIQNRKMFSIPAIMGFGHISRSGELVHPRTRIFKGFLGGTTLQIDPIPPYVQTDRTDLTEYAREFHTLVADHLCFVIPPVDFVKEERDYPYGLEYLKKANRDFAASL